MALEVTAGTTPIVLPSGIGVSSLYCRTQAWLSDNGKQVGCNPSFYTNKVAYESGAQQVYMDGINILTDYDRAVDGDDILLFSNEYIKTQLEAKGYSVVVIDL